MDRLYVPIEIVRKEIAAERNALRNEMKIWDSTDHKMPASSEETLSLEKNASKVSDLKSIQLNFEVMIHSLTKKIHFSDTTVFDALLTDIQIECKTMTAGILEVSSR